MPRLLTRDSEGTGRRGGRPDRGGDRHGRRGVSIALVAAGVLAMLVLASCGSSGSSSNGGAGGGLDNIKAGWVWLGPKDDGGWNVANAAGQTAVQDSLGGSYDQLESTNVPYTEAAAPVFEQQVTTAGANVLVDTVGYGDIFTKVCDQHPDVYCIQTAPFTKLGKNTTGWFPKLWQIEYTAGVAAGLTTKDNTVGYVLGFKIPLIIGAANAFTMGCRSVNPDCQVRIVVVNSYYDPPKTASAVSTLLDANADVIRSYTDDQGYCQAVKDKGALAIGEFWTNGEQCGDSALVSTVWDFTTYYKDQFDAIKNGNFVSRQLEFLDPKTSFKLEDWGPNVSQDVQNKVQATLDDLASGANNPFVGPIKDTSGAVQVPAGEKLTDEFLYGGWKWYVDGIVSGG